ncbi:MAG: hypothetical protein QXJ93_00430 [Candidatus Rehaiarchaeum fermentans]|nr:hypothetical protein [Candidatus Rehaiarchaeum fermentans]
MKTAAILVGIVIMLALISSAKALEISPSSINLTANSLNIVNLRLINNNNFSLTVVPLFYKTQIEYPFFKNIQSNFTKLIIPPFSNKTIELSIFTSNYYITVPNFLVNFSFYVNNVSYNLPLSVSIYPPATGKIVLSNLSFPRSVSIYNNYTLFLQVINYYSSSNVIFPVNVFLIRNNSIINKYVFNLKTYSEGTNSFNLTLPINELYFGNYSLLINSSFAQGTLTSSFYVNKLSNLVSSKHFNMNLFGGNFTEVLQNLGNYPVQISKNNLSEGDLYLFSSNIYVITKYGPIPLQSNFTIYPGERVIVGFTFNFIILYLIIILAIAELILFLLFSRKALVKKELSSYKFYNGNLEGKIIIKVKNISNKEMRDIKLYDYLPRNTEVESIGISEFQKVVGKNTVTLKWNLGSLAPGEEVIVEYSFKTRVVGVYGSLTLDKAKLEYILEGKENKKFYKYSNNLVLSISE